MSADQPELLFCPYCGRDELKHVKGVPRCGRCGAVFLVQFSRITRTRTRKQTSHNALSIVFVDEDGNAK